MKLYFIIFLLCSTISLKAQTNINLVPMPAKINIGKGNFRINANTTIVLEGSGLENTAAYFNDYLSKKYGFTLKKGSKKKDGNAIVLNFERLDYQFPGAYTIDVNSKEIYISGDNETGVFYGIQTLIQLLPTKKTEHINIPQLFINDYPRFAYRGMHLDVSRHLFSVAYIKKYIDYLALHKFNNFHWHLTDDQGWRIEIKKYPKLTEVGSCRSQTLAGRFGSDLYDSTKYCGFYSQEEIKQVVQYAAARYITIIPEIDMPGHCLAALASYPFLGCNKGPYKVMETWGVAADVLCAGNDSTYVFMQDVLDEVMQLFPGQYIHIGGDECPKEKWKTCPVCQQKMKTENLKNEHELQSYFTQRIEKYVNSKGRKIIGWDEILEGGLAPNAAVMSWRGEAGGIAAAKQNHFVVMTPERPLYLNWSQTKNEDSVTQGGYNPLEDVYNYEPIPKELDLQQSKFILGAQGNLWSEYLMNEKKLEYMLFPRMSALAEVLWTPRNKRNWIDFEKRLPGIIERYKFQGTNYSTAYYDIQPGVLVSGNEIFWKLESRNQDGKIIYVKDSNTNSPLTYKAPVLINKTGLYGAALTDTTNRVISSWIWQKFYSNKATGKKISLTTEPNKSYSMGGAFSLVDGVQNERGMLRSAQFLGFNGKNLEAIIDLGALTEINSISLHAFEQKGSWIYRPASVSFFISGDGQLFAPIESPVKLIGNKNLLYKTLVNLKARYIKVAAKNNGIIASGEPGAGNNAWLFVDEIEVN
ncbi:MAG: beta-N-acetylhexosaminidase [Ferruginibacter sp.]|nr:beta-N-acetylhexosaminidase [Ferruginibacter sp.]